MEHKTNSKQSNQLLRRKLIVGSLKNYKNLRFICLKEKKFSREFRNSYGNDLIQVNNRMKLKG